MVCVKMEGVCVCVIGDLLFSAHIHQEKNEKKKAHLHGKKPKWAKCGDNCQIINCSCRFSIYDSFGGKYNL